MNEQQVAAAKNCFSAAETGAMTFPQIVGALIQAGFEGYEIDFRRGAAAYYLPSGDSVEFPLHVGGKVAAAFDTARVQAAIKDAQRGAPGYTYKAFCETVVDAGCAGYFVSFSGRRVLYFGRTAETHTEHFPN